MLAEEFYPIETENLFWGTYTKSADPFQMPQNAAASDQALHSLHGGVSVENTIKIKISARNP